MSQYDAIYPTIRGRAMLTQALQEEKALIFTRAEWGDGVKKENQPSDLFEALIHKVIESGFTKKEQDGNVLFLTTVYDNSKLNEGFYVREVGVYAKVGEDGQEYLYAYTYANIASYTPPSKQYNEKRLKIGLAVDKAAKIEIKFNSQQYATREELDIHDSSIEAHKELFDKIAQAIGGDEDFAKTLKSTLDAKAPLASPTFTGTVTGPTPSSSANNTQFATTAWVLQSIAAHATGPIVGDVSNANGWWVKIPCQGFNLLIQGGFSEKTQYSNRDCGLNQRKNETTSFDI